MDNQSIQHQYDRMYKLKIALIATSVVAMVLCGIYFVTIGVADISMRQVVAAISTVFQGGLEGEASDGAIYKIILLMRLPRIVMAIFAGTGLAVAGVAMQGVTRNPLVSPFTIGISSAAAFGASMVIVFGKGVYFGSELSIVLSAFTSSIFCAMLLFSVAKKVGITPQSIILIGIALNYFFSALTSTIEFFAKEHRLAGVVNWTFGSFNGITWNETLITAGFVVVCSLVIYRFALMLNVISTGEDELVRSLGINPELVRIVMGVSSVLMTAAIISFTGVIGFVGLIGPHIGRLIVGNEHRFLIPFSAVIGAMLLMVSDVIGKTIFLPVSIPVGIVVSFLGVPLFINLILYKRKGRL
jgi:iron complex transport system permease protein